MLYVNPKGKFTLSPQKQRQGPRFKVSCKGLSPERERERERERDRETEREREREREKEREIIKHSL